MLPYQSSPDEGEWPSEHWSAAFAQSLESASTTSLPLSAFHNVGLGQVDSDYFVFAGFAPGQHTVYYLPDLVGINGTGQQESVGTIQFFEVKYFTYAEDGHAARHYYLASAGLPSTLIDTEAVALAEQAGAAASGPPLYYRVDFVASVPGAYSESAGGTFRDHHTGRYAVHVIGAAMDYAGFGAVLADEQTGAGRYLLTLDQYEGARDSVWGEGWFDGLGDASTGALVISELDWTDNGDGTRSASGHATIGLKNGDPDMISVLNGTYVLSADSLMFEGQVATTIEGGSPRPLFVGSAVLSLNTASGDVTQGDNSDYRLALAGLPFTLPKLQLIPGAVVLENASFDLPDEFADVPVKAEQVKVTISESGIMLEDGVASFGTEFLRLLNLVGVKPSYFEFSYDRAKDELSIGGKLQIGEDSFFPELLDAGIEGGIRVTAGELSAATLKIDGVLGIKGYGFDELELTLDTAGNGGLGSVAGSGKFLLPFPTLVQIDNDDFADYSTMQGFYAALPEEVDGDPQAWGIGVEVEYLLKPFMLDGLDLSLVLPDGIPFFSTPFVVREIGAGLGNFAADNPAPVSFSGLLGLEGISGRIFEAEIELRGDVSKQSFTGSVEGHLFDEDLVSFQGTAALDWVKDTIDAGFKMSFIDGVITAELEFKSDFDFNVTARGQASFELLGAQLDGNAYLKIVNDSDASNDYVAVWGTASVDLPLLGLRTVSKGVKYGFDGSAPQTFGAQDVALYSSWVVDEAIADLLVTVGWENAATAPVRTRVVVYEDLGKTQVRQVIEEGDYAANGIAVIEQWSGPLGTILYIAGPEPGLWDVEVVNPQGLGAITYEASTSLVPGSLVVDSATVSDTVVTIDYSAIEPNGDAQLLFFADEDDEGYDGVLIGSAPEADGTGQYVWDATGFEPGRYWLYALMEDGRSIPLEAYAPAPVRVNLGPNTAPVAAVPIADQVAMRGAAFSFVVPQASFADDDAADSLSHRATLADGDALPQWLVFEPTTRTFSGTPGAGDEGELVIRVVATDPDGAQAQDEFVLDVRTAAGQRIVGTSGHDGLPGGAGDDTIDGLAGDDVLTGGAGNDTLDGGSGSDAAVYAGALAGYGLHRVAGGYRVDDAAGADGTDLVAGVESLRFADMTVNLTVQGQAAMATPADLQLIIELYIAFFNRVPDADGLSYWLDLRATGTSVNRIADSFYAAGVQYPSLTGFSQSMSAGDFVDVVYRNVLGRQDGADPAGLVYWSGELAAGRASNGSLVTDILNSAHTFKGDPVWGWVADLLDNKVAVGRTFAVDWGLNYNTPGESIGKGMAIAAAITPDSIDEAIALIGVDPANIDLLA